MRLCVLVYLCIFIHLRLFVSFYKSNACCDGSEDYNLKAWWYFKTLLLIASLYSCSFNPIAKLNSLIVSLISDAMKFVTVWNLQWSCACKTTKTHQNFASSFKMYPFLVFFLAPSEGRACSSSHLPAPPPPPHYPPPSTLPATKICVEIQSKCCLMVRIWLNF